MSAAEPRVAVSVAQSLKFRHSKHNPSDKHEDVHVTRETAVRHGGLLFNLKFVMKSAVRYTAFTSDVGEALRPVLSSRMVNGTYGIAFAYVIGDISYHGWLARSQEGDVNRAVAHASAFQFLGSIAAPFAIIHSAVNVGQKFFTKIGRFTRWGPSVIGLSIIPALPSVCDEPAEHAVDWVFDKYWPSAPEKVE